jgi:hypothetical protein
MCLDISKEKKLVISNFFRFFFKWLRQSRKKCLTTEQVIGNPQEFEIGLI